MATYSSIPAWRIPWTEEPGRLQSTGSQRVRHDLTLSDLEVTQHSCKPITNTHTHTKTEMNTRAQKFIIAILQHMSNKVNQLKTKLSSHFPAPLILSIIPSRFSPCTFFEVCFSLGYYVGSLEISVPGHLFFAAQSLSDLINFHGLLQSMKMIPRAVVQSESSPSFMQVSAGNPSQTSPKHTEIST